MKVMGVPFSVRFGPRRRRFIKYAAVHIVQNDSQSICFNLIMKHEAMAASRIGEMQMRLAKQ